jgi:hypothetical protein
MIAKLSRALIASVLVAAGTLKLFALAEARPPEHLELGWLATFFEPPAVIAVAVVELATALLLASRAWRIGMLLTLGLSIAFLGFLVLLAQRGVEAESCGCFGAARLSGHAHILMLLGMALGAAGSLAEPTSSRRAAV